MTNLSPTSLMWIKDASLRYFLRTEIRDLERLNGPTSSRFWRSIDVRSWARARAGQVFRAAWLGRLHFEIECLAIRAAAAGRTGGRNVWGGRAATPENRHVWLSRKRFARLAVLVRLLGSSFFLLRHQRHPDPRGKAKWPDVQNQYEGRDDLVLRLNSARNRTACHPDGSYAQGCPRPAYSGLHDRASLHGRRLQRAENTYDEKNHRS